MIFAVYSAENCLCQNRATCQICRLQKRVKNAEFAEYEARRDLDAALARITALERLLGQYIEDQELEDDVEQAEGVDQGEYYELESDKAEETEETEEDQSTESTELAGIATQDERAETEKRQLLADERLNRENQILLNKTRAKRNSSTNQMIQMTEPTFANPSTGASSGFRSNIRYLEHGHGGKGKPKTTANTGAGIVGKTRGTTGRKSGSTIWHSEVDAVKGAKKHLRNKDDEDDDEDEDLEPPSKRRRSVKSDLGSTPQGGNGKRKTGVKTCGSEQVAGKKRQYDTDDDGDDEDYYEPSHRRGLSSQSLKSNPNPSLHKPISNQTAAKSGRHTNYSRNGFLDAVGTAKPGRVTNNSLSGFIDYQPDANTLVIPKQSSPFVVTTDPDLTISTPANSTQAGTRGRRAQGWDDRELQALISLVRAHHNQPIGPNGKKPEVLRDVRLFELMSRQLQQQHGIFRSAGACKNEWNRRGRQISGIENRKVPNPNQMATSLQKPR